MNYVRIIIGLLVAVGAYFQVSEHVTTAFSSSNKIVIDGLVNIWASIAMLLICPYLTMYTVKNTFSLRLQIGNTKHVVIVLSLVVAPLLTFAIYSKAHSNVANYIECKDQRQLSSRYSSRTYAISREVCESLEVR